MDIELQKYYEARLSMMGDKGWKELIEDVDRMIEATNSINSVTDEKSLYFAKGELSILNWIKNLREISEEAYQNLKDEDARS